ncbi:PAS domain-containing protein [Candidatus Sumerlaeota bacterium]|nr:PAS domain-containing protein [Candidatus Sumerlaeota bacterium]
MKISHKLTLIFLGLALGPLVLGSILTYIDARDAFIRQTRTRLDTVAALEEHGIEKLLQEYTEQAQQLANNPALLENLNWMLYLGDVEAAEKVAFMLEEVVAVSDELVALEIISPEGKVVASTRPERVGSMVEEKQKPLDEGMLHIDRLYRDQDRRLLIQFDEPLYYNLERPLGSLKLLMQADDLQALTDDYSGLGVTGEILLARRTPDHSSAELLAPTRFDPDATLNRTIHLTSSSPLMFAFDPDTIQNSDWTDYRGKRVLASTRLIRSAGWALVVKIDRDEALNEAKMLANGMMQIFILVSLCTLLVALAVSRSLTLPLIRLTQTAHRIASGETNLRVNIDSANEIGSLADSFNIMAQTLTEYGEELERRVQQRTEQLRKANTALRQEVRQRLRAARILSDERNRLRTLIENLPCGIVVKDRNSRYNLINRSQMHLLGLESTRQALGRTAMDLHPGEAAKVALEDDERVMSTGEPLINVERIQVNPGMHNHHTLITKAPLRNKDNEIVGLVGIIYDITERKQIEQRLIQTAEELQRSNAELEQFAYIASHDLQEPLRMMTSFIQLLQRRYHGKLDAEADEYITFAVDGAIRMQRLINDLLAYSRVGTRGGEFESVDCGQIVQAAMDNLHLAIEESQARIELDSLPTLLADPSQLTQLFQNLLANAIKFRGENTPEIRIEASESGGGWRFCVRDNGIGIALDARERIFQIFQRLHSREEYEGTGIGLALCQRIVLRHGGRIWVESEPGKGSAFFFTLPVNTV